MSFYSYAGATFIASSHDYDYDNGTNTNVINVTSLGDTNTIIRVSADSSTSSNSWETCINGWKITESTGIPSISTSNIIKWEMISSYISPQEKLKQILQKRMTPYIISSRKPMKNPYDAREEKARETLRRVIGDSQFRNFLKNGFVSAKAKSGKIYQIFPGNDMTKVYSSGQLVEKLCIVLKGRFPPTDSVIMRYLMVLNNEDKFREKAVRWSASAPYRRILLAKDERSLTEIYAGLKVG